MAVTATMPVHHDQAPYTRLSYDRLDFRAMGTFCQLIYTPRSHAAGSDFARMVKAWVAKFDHTFSRFDPASLVSRINSSAGSGEWIKIDDEALSIFKLCDWFHWSTKGIFDPATLPLLKLWDYHNPAVNLPDAGRVRNALALCGWAKIERQPDAVRLPVAGMGIDIGGIGKEYAVDRVFEMAIEQGMSNVMVNFGNDVRVAGEPPEGGPWRIGLEDPAHPGQCWAGAALTDRAVTTSGDYLRNFEVNGRRYGHIIDPRSGYPVDNNCRAVTVIGATCTEAGILSTSAFIMGPDEGIRFIAGFFQNEGCIIAGDTRYRTRRFDEYIRGN